MSSPSENCPDCGGTGEVLKWEKLGAAEYVPCHCTKNDTEPHDPDR
jgi:hypothetical protein